jgi:uncharacterized RDD family membrane protein YckC
MEMNQMEMNQISTSNGIRYAGFGRRALAALLDLIFLAVPVTWIVKSYLTQPPSILDRRLWGSLALEVRTYDQRIELEKALVHRTYNALFLVFWLPALYYIPAECSPLRGTLGKRILRLQVTDTNGRPIGIRRSAKRYLMRGLSTALWLTGYAMAAFTARKQALHDILAGTLVVMATKPPTPGNCP